jgi:hypothetical protein
MELRHPGYIASPVPYGDRYTMFFGHPSHKYWSRPLSEIERGGWGIVESFLQTIGSSSSVSSAILSTLASGSSAFSYANKIRKKFKPETLKNKDLHGQESNLGIAYKQFNEYMKWLVKGRAERYKPFRQFHFLSSENNIIMNNMKASAHGTFNAVDITYLSDKVVKASKTISSTSEADSPRDLTEAEAQREILKAVHSKGVQLKIKADDNIEEHHTRMMQALFTSCFEDFYARRYATGLLMRSLRDVYKGTVVVTGNPKIKPYDVCVLFDSYRDIYGPVEVEQVQHIMSQETGFVTEIKPDLILTHNAATTQCTMDGMVKALTDLYSKIADESNQGVANGVAVTAGVATAGAIAGTGLLAGGVGFGLLALGGYKLVEWTTARQPIVITPVMNGVKPLIAGLDGYKRDDLWVSLDGRLRKFSDSMTEGWKDIWERSPVSSWWHEKLAEWLN